MYYFIRPNNGPPHLKLLYSWGRNPNLLCGFFHWSLPCTALTASSIVHSWCCPVSRTDIILSNLFFFFYCPWTSWSYNPRPSLYPPLAVVSPNPSVLIKLTPEGRLNTCKWCLINILRSKVKHNNNKLMNFQEASTFVFFVTSILRTLFMSLKMNIWK